MSGGFLHDVVAFCWGAAAAPGAAGAGLGGFRCPGRRAGQGGQAGEIAADAAGAELALAAAAFPALLVVFGDGAGEAELGDCRDDEPCPAGQLRGVAEGGLVPAEGVLGEAVGVLDGLITNDKFCCVRRLRLSLSWWRRPLRLRASVLQTDVALSGEPDDPDPDVDHLPPAQPAP